MRRRRKVKILATLGPSSSDKAKIRSLVDAGADVFRINMSHTDHPTLRRMVNTIRAIEAESDRPIGILADLQGPKLRLGTFAEGKIGRDDDRGALVEPTDQMEQELAAGTGKGQVTEFIEDQQIDTAEPTQ